MFWIRLPEERPHSGRENAWQRARIAFEAAPGLSFTAHVPVGIPLAVGERVELHCRPDEIIPLDE